MSALESWSLIVGVLALIAIYHWGVRAPGWVTALAISSFVIIYFWAVRQQ